MNSNFYHFNFKFKRQLLYGASPASIATPANISGNNNVTLLMDLENLRLHFTQRYAGSGHLAAGLNPRTGERIPECNTMHL